MTDAPATPQPVDHISAFTNSIRSQSTDSLTSL